MMHVNITAGEDAGLSGRLRGWGDLMGITIHRVSFLALSFVFSVCVFSVSGETVSKDHVPVEVSCLAALNAATEVEKPLIADIKLDATVWWSSTTDGRVILKDDTAMLQLQFDFPASMPDWGAVIELDGRCVATKTRDVIKLSGIPVVDHDGLHPPESRSGTRYLEAGMHPIRVNWFNRTERFDLKLSYEGPDRSMQPIPEHVLYHRTVDEGNGTTNYVRGLKYRCYEGSWWRFLPNFDHIDSIETGVVDNFSIEVRSRDHHVGIQFLGYIQIDQAGLYTFRLLSDDGSRLFVGDSSFDILANPVPSGRIPVSLPLGDHHSEQTEYQWASIEGTVAAVHRSSGPLEIDLMTNQGLVKVMVAEDSEFSSILRPQNRIRASGVSRRIHDLDGPLILGELYIQRWDEVEQLYISPRTWDEFPITRIVNLEEQRSGKQEPFVRLKGRVIEVADTDFTGLDDGTGMVILESNPALSMLDGQMLDLLGTFSTPGTNPVMACLHYRVSGSDGVATNKLPVLTTADEVCQLSLEEAALGYPVNVRGVITSSLDYNGAVIQDSTRGIYVNTGDSIPLQVGEFCEIEGVTGPFGFQPYIQVTRLKKLGTGVLPVPVKPSWDQLLNGGMHCKYVELEGIVSSVHEFSVVLLTRDGFLNVRLSPFGPEVPKHLQGAMIRMQGCLLADWDGDSRRVEVGSFSIDQQKVSVIRPAPAEPFSAPLKHVGEILQFDPQAGALQRVRVSGVLIYKDTQASYLMDEEHGLRFLSKSAMPDAWLGEAVEVVGFVDLNEPSPLLREAQVRHMGPASSPLPKKLHGEDLLRNEYDSTLVSVTGILLDVSRRGNGIVLEVQNGLFRFMAILENFEHLETVPDIGSQLELSGVYEGMGGNRFLGQPMDTFQLLLSSRSDIHVLSRPPWWTLKRLISVVAILLAIILGALIWISSLHRKVEERTHQLGDQIRQRQLSEHQRAIEHERARLAHDLHDDLGAGLTEVNMLSALVKNPAIEMEKRNGYADKMNTLALRMVSSLDEIVWAENPRYDTVSSLAAYFESYACRLLDPTVARCSLDIADKLPEHQLDPQFRQGLFLAFKEALTNVIKHAEATEVRLSIRVTGEQLLVEVADNGCGIGTGAMEAGADGLTNMKERLASIGGCCRIRSDPATGTSVGLEVPLGKKES